MQVKNGDGILEIIKLNIADIKPYEKNAKIHTEEQIEQIKKSIEEFGMNDPIAVWGDDNLIVEGHGRLEALKQLGYDEVECIRLDHLSDEERKAYTLAHNKLTMNTDFDLDVLNQELENIKNINMENFGFMLEELEEITDSLENLYTTKINIPQYEITGDEPKIDELVDKEKVDSLKEIIDNSNISDEQKEFLKIAATRLYTFNYSNIAEYYAHQNKEMQELMEKLALVIIDIKDAIANGYVELSSKLEEMLNDEA